MKILHIVCMVLMIAMMQHTCLADEQTEITYGDGWTHYNYTDGTQAHKLAPTNYLRWDGEWRPKTELDFFSGDWPYMVEEFETYYLITRLDDTLTLSKTYRTYNFQPYKIGVHLTLTPTQLNQISTYHNVGGTDHWYIIIPRSLKETARYLNWDNKLPTVSNETGIILNQSDNVSGEWQPNYKYQNVGGELRLYYNQIARGFGIASTEVIFDFNSYIINSSIGWANTSYSNFAYDRNTGYLILPDNVTDGLVLYHKMSGSSGITSYDMNETSNNNGILTNMNTGLDNGTSGWNSSGKYGNAIGFDGVNDYVDCGSGSSLDITDAITIEAWIKPNTVVGGDTFSSTNPRYIMYKGVGIDDSNYFFRILGNRLDFGFYADGAFQKVRETVGNGTVVAGEYQQVAITFESNGIGRIYRNGAETYNTNLAYTMVASTIDLAIGGDPLGSQRYFSGSIDSVRIYNRALSNDEINQTMNNTMKTSDNVTHWHDAGSGYHTVSFIVNITTPTNTNYTVWYADNGSSFSQIGGTYTGNQTLLISGTKYQNTDLRIVMNGNTTATPEEMEVTIVTEASAAGAALTTLISPAQYDELDLPLILYILMLSLLYLLIAFRQGVAAVELSLIYLIFVFFFFLFQTITISVNYIYLTLFLLLFLISIAGIIKQGVD